MVSHPRIGSDTQIKIWGIRIELSDMESNIIAASGAPLRQAMATLVGQGDGGFLVAHVVFAPVQSHSGVNYAGASGSLDKSSLSGIPSSEPPKPPVHGACCCHPTSSNAPQQPPPGRPRRPSKVTVMRLKLIEKVQEITSLLQPWFSLRVYGMRFSGPMAAQHSTTT